MLEREKLAERRITSAKKRISSHRNIIEEWFSYLENGIHPFSKPVTKNYIRILTYDILSFQKSPFWRDLKVYQTLIDSLKRLERNQISKKKSLCNTMSCFTKFLYHQELVSREEYNKITSIKVKSHYEPVLNCISPEDLNKVLREIDSYHKPVLSALIRIFQFTGVRVSGVIDLRVEHVDFDSHLINFYQQKGGKNIKVGINKELEPYLINYYRKRPKVKYDHFFINPVNNKPFTIDYLINFIKKVHSKVGISFGGFQPYRRFFARYYASKGVPIPTLQKVLGHSDYKTTLHYVNPDINEIVLDMRDW